MKGAQPIFREEWRELTMICSIFPSLLFLFLLFSAQAKGVAAQVGMGTLGFGKEGFGY
jgi:hypothetical protein